MSSEKEKSEESEGVNTKQEDLKEKEVVVSSNENVTKSLADLSHTSIFSIGSLVAISLHTLFDNPHDKKFTKQYLNYILDALKVPDKMRESCHLQLDGEYPEGLLQECADQLKREEIYCVSLLRELLVVSLEKCKGYDARVRVLFKQLCHLLSISWDELEALEDNVTSLVTGKADNNEDAIGESQSRQDKRKRRRYFMIGLAAVGGGALIGLTGGLAAPLVAAGAGAIIGTSSAAIIGTTAGAAILGSVFGAAGAGLTGWRMNRRVGALQEFEFHPLTKGPPRLCITIAIAGFLKKDAADFESPWSSLAHSKEQYYLQWETKYLLEMGQAMEYFLHFAKKFAIKEVLKMTILSGILAAIAWPSALVTASNVIDNPWSVCINRSEEAGVVLAEALLSREQGGRPVTLIGYSMGARVIYYCLKELSKRQAGVDGIIEDVYVIGAPVSAVPEKWARFEKVVAGRIFNAYCKTDWLLRFLFRTATVNVSLAGLQPVAWRNRRMVNVDVTSEVEGHLHYLSRMREILALIGVRTSVPLQEPDESSDSGIAAVNRSPPPNLSHIQSLPDVQVLLEGDDFVTSEDLDEARDKLGQSDNQQDAVNLEGITIMSKEEVDALSAQLDNVKVEQT